MKETIGEVVHITTVVCDKQIMLHAVNDKGEIWVLRYYPHEVYTAKQWVKIYAPTSS